MWISSDRAGASGRQRRESERVRGRKKGTMGNVLYVSEMHKYTKDTCVFNGIFFFFFVGKSVSHFDSQKNLVKQIRPRPAEQFNYSAWL